MIDYKKVFKGSAVALVVLKPNHPDFTILSANDKYLAVTHSKLEDIIDKPLFQAFDDNNVNSPNAAIIRGHLLKAIQTKKTQLSLVIKYSIKIENNVYVDRFWTIDNTPIVENGEVLYIVQNATDLTPLIEKGLELP